MTHPELRALVDSDPFPGLTHGPASYLTASFVKGAARDPVAIPGGLDPGTGVVRFDGACRTVLAVTDNTEPNTARGFTGWLETTYGKDVTTRSWLTVRRIVRTLES